MPQLDTGPKHGMHPPIIITASHRGPGRHVRRPLLHYRYGAEILADDPARHLLAPPPRLMAVRCHGRTHTDLYLRQPAELVSRPAQPAERRAAAGRAGTRRILDRP